MKKILIIILTVFILVIIILFLLYMLNFNISRAGMRDELRSVKESKEYGVFVSEYYNPNGFVSFPDNNKLYIKESWIEHSWTYDYWMNADINCRNCKGVHSLYIVFKEQMSDYFKNRITFQWKKGESGYAKENELTDKTWNQVSVSSRGYKSDDTLKVYVTKYYPETRKDDTITLFILVKKK